MQKNNRDICLVFILFGFLTGIAFASDTISGQNQSISDAVLNRSLIQERGTVELNPILVKMFKFANEKDVDKLEKMRSVIKNENNRKFSSAYALALYMSSPTKYCDDYVKEFPADNEGMRYIYDVEIAGLTPKYLYSIDAIGAIAEKGNSVAIKKILLGVANSDAGAAELFCEHFEKIMDKYLYATIVSFSKLDPISREKTYKCFELMSAQEIDKIKSRLRNQKASKKEAIVIKEILSQ
jgi:hypothetical protein